MEDFTYLRLYDHYLSYFKNLSDSEFGRMIRAALVYHALGDEPVLDGMEHIMFPVIKEDIDFEG